MATRPRITFRSYEDFQPLSSLLQEEEGDTFIVDLPGFRKEQIKVQMDDSGTVLISGERPIGNNKWSRFRKDLRVPINSNTNEIQAKFENGVLRIILPKMKTGDKKQNQNVQTKVATPSQKPVAEPKPTAPTKQEVPKPNTTPTPPVPPSRKPVFDPKPTPTPQAPPKEKPNTTVPPPPSPSQKLGTERKPVPTPPPPPSQKLVTEPKPTPTTQSPLSEKQKTTPTPLGEVILSRPRSKVPPIPLSKSQSTEPKHTASTSKSPPIQEPESKSKSDHGQNSMWDYFGLDTPTNNTNTQNVAAPISVGKPIDLKTNKSENGENDAQKIAKEKNLIDGLVDSGKVVVGGTSGKQEKGKEISDTQKMKDEIKENVTHGVEDYKKRIRGFTTELGESDKPYIVNMVVAILVIVALGVYINYTIKFPWKS